MAYKQNKIFASCSKNISGLGQYLNAQFESWKEGEKILFLLLILNILYSLWVACSHVLRYFPTTYAAGEMLISYSAGMLRRGLLGTVLSFFADSPWLPVFAVCLMLALYLGFIFCAAKFLFRYLERFWAIVLLGAPSIFMFFGYSQEEFLRKDIIIMVAICAMLLVIVRARRQEWWLGTILFVLTLIYAPAFLIHELSLMFLGFPLALLFGTSKKEGEKVWIAVYAVLIACASLLFAFKFSGTAEQREIIIAFWKSYFPDLKTSAMENIGSGLANRDAAHYSLAYFKVYTLRLSIIKGWLLSLLPIAGFWYHYSINLKLKRLCGLWGAVLFMAQALLAWLAVIIIMNDMGRIIAFFSILLVSSGLAILALSPIQDTERKALLPDLNNYWVFILTAVYLYCWKLEQWVPLSAQTYFSPQFWQSRLLFGS